MTNFINIGNDCWDIINNYKYQIEHSQKYSKCMNEINKIEYKIYRVHKKRIISSYRNGRCGTRYDLCFNEITRRFDITNNTTFKEEHTRLFWKNHSKNSGCITDKNEVKGYF